MCPDVSQDVWRGGGDFQMLGHPEDPVPKKGVSQQPHPKGTELLVFCGSECKERLLCPSQPWGLRG